MKEEEEKGGPGGAHNPGSDFGVSPHWPALSSWDPMAARPRFEPAPSRPAGSGPSRRGPLGSVALRGMRAAVAVLAVAAAAAAVAALPPRAELLPYGAAHGDGRLRHGDDESSPGVVLRPPMRLYGRAARRLFVSPRAPALPPFLSVLPSLFLPSVRLSMPPSVPPPL